MNWILNIYLWIGVALSFALIIGFLLLIFVIIAKKTHMIVELKGMIRGLPIALYFQENRYCEWKPAKSEAGIINDKNYGAFIINERATYIDKKTKNILIPFDAQFGASINIHAAKLADDLQFVIKDEEQMKALREAIALDNIDENQSINVLKTSVHIGAIKTMMTALIPHNINSKIEKIVASRMKGYGKADGMQFLLIFGGVLGAIIVGYILLKTVAI